MKIGRFLVEAISESVVVDFLKGAWHILIGAFRGGAQQKIGQVITSHLKPGGSLEDEEIYSACLAEAKIDTSKKALIRRTICMLEYADEAANTHMARNFRFMIALDTYRKRELDLKKDHSVKIEKIEKPAGVKILEELGKSCSSESELMLAMMATGALTSAPLNIWDRLEHLDSWAKESFLPMVKSQTVQLDAWAKKKEAEYNQYEKKGFFRKLFLNFID